MKFEPLFRNAHLQTIAAHYWRRPEARGVVSRRLFRTAPEAEVLVESVWPEGQARGQIVMVHGLEASGQAGYMRSLSHAAVEAHYAAHRFHMRTCGGTEHLAATLYHAGLTGDLAAVVAELVRADPAPVYLVGFSLGGNVVLKLAGEQGEAALFRGVCAVSTPLDLAACTGRIERRDNRIYQARFVRRMRRRLCATGRYRPEDFRGLRTIRDIDERITAPEFGFRGAAHYYETQSAIRYLEGIRVPALLIQSRDDTFIPYEVYERRQVRANPRVEVLTTRHGGHLGFLARGARRFWADAAVVEWINRLDGTNRRAVSSTE
jgi:predicted alpha/beta-fold hydrolase